MSQVHCTNPRQALVLAGGIQPGQFCKLVFSALRARPREAVRACDGARVGAGGAAGHATFPTMAR